MRLKALWILLFFPMMAFAKEKPFIILDPGHGGRDEGARLRTLQEKQLTLRTAYLTKKHLENLGYRVILTRARDVFLPLKTRVFLANRRSPALFVSIHYNSAAATTAKGIEIYYYGSSAVTRKTASKKLATSILNQMIKETGANSRGVKRGNFQVIRETSMPSVLVEAGFLTNSEERALLGSQVYLDKLAKGIAYGVDKHVK